jgi:hypothetical protein
VGEHLHHHLHDPQHQHHLHFKIQHHPPLKVCGRSNPGYCVCAVCIFVLGILSIFYGEVIFFRLCCNPYHTDHDHVWHLWVVPLFLGA